MGRQGLSAQWGARSGESRPWALRGTLPADLTIKRVDKQMRRSLLVRSDCPKVLQGIGEREVFVKHTRAVMALPPTLIGLYRPVEPRHPASVPTPGGATKCRRSRLDRHAAGRVPRQAFKPPVGRPPGPSPVLTETLTGKGHDAPIPPAPLPRTRFPLLWWTQGPLVCGLVRGDGWDRAGRSRSTARGVDPPVLALHGGLGGRQPGRQVGGRRCHLRERRPDPSGRQAYGPRIWGTLAGEVGRPAASGPCRAPPCHARRGEPHVRHP
jgi:hypothetical protein